jgi:hypothetical protein
MNLEREIENCEYNLKQIKHFNPDPFYVNHFLKNYIQCVVSFYQGILEEVDKNFGLFSSEPYTTENFEDRCKEKNDQIALEFLLWFKENYEKEHDNPYPNFINELINLIKGNYDCPKISIKMLAEDRYTGDFVQAIKVRLKNEKLISNEELKIEIKKHLAIFLEIINKKRKNCNEPKVAESQVIASTFLEMEGFEEMEIPYACQVYIPVMKRILGESRKKVRSLTN